MTVARQRLGRAAEDLVTARLCARGWRIVARNARTRYGEIDIVALAGGTLVFVEVKATRAGGAAGPERPALAVGFAKQARIRRLAAAWLSTKPRLPRYGGLRFDVVGVSYGRDGHVMAYEHIVDAF